MGKEMWEKLGFPVASLYFLADFHPALDTAGSAVYAGRSHV